MNIREIAPGLSYWTAPHPDWRGATDWPEDVGCVYYEAPDTTIVIDPLVPKGEEDEFWAMLDRWVEPRGLAVSVLLTAPWHQRSAAIVAERYGVIVWAHESAQRRLSFPVQSGPLPTGVEAFVPGGASEGQVAFLLREHRALVVAEFFMGVNGGLRVLPAPAEQDSNAFYDSLRRLLDLPIEHVLVAHGEPVLGDGRKRIAEALGSHG
jgi:glyoxylase-like metal-dependent hydrolase (beta-lactamase superfamily II)